MFIFFIIISINVISAEVTNDTKFINSLPEIVKKVFLDKVSRRILDEVPEVESGEAAMAEGEIIESKLEEQGEFVNKILREEIDSLKARRRNTLDDNFVMFESNAPSEKNTSLKTPTETEWHGKDEMNRNNTENVIGNTERNEHIDLALRAKSKRAGDNDLVEMELRENNNKYSDDINKDKNVPNEVNEKERIAKLNISKEFQKFSAYEKNETNDMQSLFQNSERTSNKIFKSDNNDVKLLPLNVRVSANISLPELNRTTTNDYLTNSFRAENNHDSSFIDQENVSSEFLKNTSLNKTVTIKNYDPTQKQIVTAIPIQIFTEKSDIETRQRILTTNPSSITTSYQSTEIYEKVTLNSEIMRTSPENVNNNYSMKIKSDIIVNLQTKKSCNMTDTLNGTKTACEKTNKPGYSNKAHDIKNVKVKVVQNNEINLGKKKPFNKTNTLNETKSDCTKSTNVQITKENNDSVHGNDDKLKYFLRQDSRPPVRKQSSSSAEHFADLRGVKEHKANIDSNIQTIVQRNTNDNVDQPHYLNVYNYETNNVHYNAYNRLGPNVNDYGSKDKLYESKSYLRGNLQDYNRKHSSSAEHFGDLQIAKEYKVFEVDATKPSFIQVNKYDNVEQPNYFPVYNYEPKNVHYNAYNHLGPNVGENIDGDHVYESNVRDIKDTRNVDLATDNDKLFEETSFEDYKRSARIRPQKPKFKGYGMDEVQDKFMPESFEVAHPFQSIKNRLLATRHILHKNKMFGYVPTNEERTNKYIVAMKRLFKNNTEWIEILGTSKEDTRKDKEVTDLKNTYEFDKDYDIDKSKDESNEEESDEKTEDSYQNILYSGYAPSKWNIPWNEKGRKVADKNGITYNLVFGQELRKPPRDFLKFKVSDKPNENFHDNIRLDIIDKNIYKDGSHGSVHETDITKINSHKKRSEKKNNKNIGSEREGNNIDRKTKVIKKMSAPSYRFEIKSRPTIDLRSQYTSKFDSGRNLEQNGPQKTLNIIKQVINMTSEIDMLTNTEEMKENNLPIMRSRDHDMDVHVNILKDMVKTGNPALDRYDWLVTTVDILAAMTKLLDLIYRKESRRYIHPSDLEILKYTEAIYEAARNFTLQREEETSKLEIEEYDRRIRHRNRKLPKMKKKIGNPLKIIHKMYKVRSLADKVRTENMAPLNLEDFLTSLQNALSDFHNLIKQISIITKYKHQRWYNNIKELYLVRAERKEYLEILLHLFSTRLFGLIEESSKNGANLDHEAYIKNNKAQVDRTEVEVMFILRILKAISNSRN